MKYILSILLVALLSGCSDTTGETAKKLGAGVKKCCSSLCLSKKAAAVINTAAKEDAAPVSAFPAFLLERSSEVLTW